jgi:hypothetical protein
MNFYYRSLPEGRCEVVCTRSFRTLGAARELEEIRRIESRHQCAPKRPADPPPRPISIAPPRDRTRVRILGLTMDRNSLSRVTRNAVLALMAALLLYGLPTALEFAALRHWNPWVSTLLPGDATGCLCLGIVFRKMKAGILLYCLLTAFEACAYGLHIMPLSVLPWFTDLVPTLVVSAMVLWPAEGGARLITIR